MIVMSRAERFGVRGRACDTDVAVTPVVVVVVGGSWGGGGLLAYSAESADLCLCGAFQR